MKRSLHYCISLPNGFLNLFNMAKSISTLQFSEKCDIEKEVLAKNPKNQKEYDSFLKKVVEKHGYVFKEYEKYCSEIWGSGGSDDDDFYEDSSKKEDIFVLSQKRKSVEKTTLKDGYYEGKMSGWVVTILVGGRKCEIKMNFGLKGMNIPCQVTVKDGWVYVK